MGLSVEVGALKFLRTEDPEGAEWLREQLELASAHLRRNGLPEHVEPTDGLEVVSFEMYGYVGLHYLRRLAVHVAASGRLPQPGDGKAPDDPLLKRCYVNLDRPARRERWFSRRVSHETAEQRFAHLIDHSDAEGFYVPIDFDRVIRASDDAALLGERLGSSNALVRELEELAAALGVPAGLDPEADELWEAADAQGSGATTWQRYGIESFTCVRLLHAARHSLSTGAALVFA